MTYWQVVLSITNMSCIRQSKKTNEGLGGVPLLPMVGTDERWTLKQGEISLSLIFTILLDHLSFDIFILKGTPQISSMADILRVLTLRRVWGPACQSRVHKSIGLVYDAHQAQDALLLLSPFECTEPQSISKFMKIVPERKNCTI